MPMLIVQPMMKTSTKSKCSKSICFFTFIIIFVILTVLSVIPLGTKVSNKVKYIPVNNKSTLFVNKTKYLYEKSLFVPMITPEEKKAFRDAMKAFHKAVRYNITYFLYGGTLLGSYRHHGMIPWDDDLDLLVRDKDRNVLRECLKSISPEFELNTARPDSWKVFHRESFKTRMTWRWPFLDIFFYLENDKVFWSPHWNLKRYKYPKKDVFPLVRRPFMGMLLPAPKNTSKIVSMHFDINTCKSNNYNHKKEVFVSESKRVQVPCDALSDLYPFVQRTEEGNKTIETLQGGGFHGNSTFTETPFDAEDDEDFDGEDDDNDDE